MRWRSWAVFLLIWGVNVLSPCRTKKVREMRRIDLIVIHCTATREDRRFTEEMLEECHLERGFDGCGYHFYIRRDGNIIAMRPIEKIGAHARGHNKHSIGIAYEGGINARGVPANTLTHYQQNSLQQLVSSLLRQFPQAKVVGHRDLSPDLDGNGRIEPHEWMKSCPCFDVKDVL